MSTYNPNFPVDGFPLDNFEPFVQNWNSLNNTFAIDHTLFSDPNDVTKGHHKKVLLNDVQPDPTLSVPQSQVYSKAQPVSIIFPPSADTYRALFFAQKPTTGSQIVRQLTDLPHVNGTSVDTGITLTFRIYDTPWGWRIMFGNVNPGFSGSRNFTLSQPSLGLILVTSGSYAGGNGQLSVSATANSGAITVFSSAAIGANIMAISTNI